ncbi:MAG: MBL fold metallo-hydrolase [Flavipsychrobacter sp.]|nr:MBL fold metallo-hydrolase [Flavipsychrobacter sp.]
MKLLSTLFVLLSLAFPGQAQTDAITTSKGILEIHPVYHGSFWMNWNSLNIAVDPYGGFERYKEMGKADLVLITDIHGDHLDSSTLVKLDLVNTVLVAPKLVKDRLVKILPQDQKILELANGDSLEWSGIRIHAIPMYNLPDTAGSRHPRGRGNGYLLTIGGKRIYISGDTEDIPEMRNLKRVDIAFLCMNKPYTMDIQQAASATLAFRPAIVYPFHFRQPGGFSDIKEFARLVEEGDASIEVRIRSWY